MRQYRSDRSAWGMSCQFKRSCACALSHSFTPSTHTRPTLLNVYEFVKWLRFDVIAFLQFSYGRKYPFSFATTKKQNRRAHTHTLSHGTLHYNYPILESLQLVVFPTDASLRVFLFFANNNIHNSHAKIHNVVVIILVRGTWHWRTQSTVDMMFRVHPLSTIYYCFSCLSPFFRLEWIAHAVNVVVCCTSLRLVSAV